MTNEELLLAEVRELRARVEEAHRAAAIAAREADPLVRRMRAGAVIWQFAAPRPASRLEAADVLTPEAAVRGRDAIEAIDGVGPVTMTKLDAAMAERRIEWAETG